MLKTDQSCCSVTHQCHATLAVRYFTPWCTHLYWPRRRVGYRSGDLPWSVGITVSACLKRKAEYNRRLFIRHKFYSVKRTTKTYLYRRKTRREDLHSPKLKRLLIKTMRWWWTTNNDSVNTIAKHAHFTQIVWPTTHVTEISVDGQCFWLDLVYTNFGRAYTNESGLSFVRPQLMSTVSF